MLLATFALAFVYELWRATVMAGTTPHDSMHTLVTQGLPFYIVAAVVIALLFAGYKWAAWVGLVFSIACILVSIFYYNPQIMLGRKPGIIDWFEDLVYTGLLFVAAAQLLYVVRGKAQ